MKTIKLFLTTALLLLATQTFANNTQMALLNTEWIGAFHTITGSGQIQIRFLAEPSATGEIPYFHKIEKSSLFTHILGLVDGACEFTPRYLSIDNENLGETMTGKIHVYKCEKSSLMEDVMSHTPDREAKQEITVENLQFDEANGKLRITAKILGTKVTYDLSRTQ